MDDDQKLYNEIAELKQEVEHLNRTNQSLQHEKAVMEESCEFWHDEAQRVYTELEHALDKVGQWVWKPIDEYPNKGRVVLFCDEYYNVWVDSDPDLYIENGCGHPPIYYIHIDVRQILNEKGKS